MRARGPRFAACPLLVVACLAGGGACAWGPGEPFATVDARLEAALEVPADRVLDGGWVQLASGYQLRVDALVLTAEHLALIDAGDGGAAFDPANPPPGYGLCHNGHCHADDGRLVSYEEIAAELAGGGGGGGGGGEVLAFPVGPIDLVAGEARALPCAPADCTLPLANVTVARLELTTVEAHGMVRDGRATPRLDDELPWTLALTLDDDGASAVLGSLDLRADRRHDPDVELTAELAPSPALFDGIDWAAALPAGADEIPLADDPAAREAFLEQLVEAPLTLRVRR